MSRFRTEFVGVNLDRPREGDLIYIKLGELESLFEIKKVAMDKDYHQLNRNYTYFLKCELFQSSHEELPDDASFEAYRNMSAMVEEFDGTKLLQTLGLPVDDFNEESELIEDEVDGLKTFDPNNPFGN